MSRTRVRRVASLILFALGPVIGCERGGGAPGDASAAGEVVVEDGPRPRAAGTLDSLGTVRVGDLDVSLWQGPGEIAPGGEVQLVIDLPYGDDGATRVRGWLGSADRRLWPVSDATYVAAHDDYVLQVPVADSLPAEKDWWIELVQPDGARLIGAAALEK